MRVEVPTRKDLSAEANGSLNGRDGCDLRFGVIGKLVGKVVRLELTEGCHFMSASPLWSSA